MVIRSNSYRRLFSEHYAQSCFTRCESQDLYQLSRQTSRFLSFAPIMTCNLWVVFVETISRIYRLFERQGLAVCPSDAVTGSKEACNYISPFQEAAAVFAILLKRYKMQGKWHLTLLRL